MKEAINNIPFNFNLFSPQKLVCKDENDENYIGEENGHIYKTSAQLIDTHRHGKVAKSGNYSNYIQIQCNLISHFETKENCKCECFSKFIF